MSRQRQHPHGGTDKDDTTCCHGSAANNNATQFCGGMADNNTAYCRSGAAIRSAKQDDIYGASNIVLPCPGS